MNTEHMDEDMSNDHIGSSDIEQDIIAEQVFPLSSSPLSEDLVLRTQSQVQPHPPISSKYDFAQHTQSSYLF